jgi:putative membrane protein
MIVYKVWLSIHFISLVAWFAGLFYLPRLFVYHTKVRGEEAHELFCMMERKLYKIIMVPAFLLTVFSGLSMIYLNTFSWFLVSPWLHTKLLFVFILIGFHHYLGFYVKKFAKKENKRSEKFFRILNEVPTVILITIVILVTFKP